MKMENCNFPISIIGSFWQKLEFSSMAQDKIIFTLKFYFIWSLTIFVDNMCTNSVIIQFI